MLAFFRRLTHSKVGVIITFLVLGVIALAFAAGDVTGLSSMTGGAGITGGDVAKVGKADVTANQLKTQAQTEMEGFRQQQPTLDMATFVNQGGFDGTLDRIISSMALEQFGRAQGMVVSKRAIDGQIASIPALQGPTGKFDENLYRQVLAQRKLTDAQIRSDIERDTFAQQLTLPSNGATQVASQLALPLRVAAARKAHRHDRLHPRRRGPRRPSAKRYGPQHLLSAQHRPLYRPRAPRRPLRDDHARGRQGTGRPDRRRDRQDLPAGQRTLRRDREA
ncbi:SurA N-terminal domain-containing protein [Sphingomonas sp. H160509]|uniref:SurA N-terminal domain-containing protein n=1 Tax=Sphingomonas sp. H160509 TaxID=2955313 RepID=UPI002096E49D|nr:SurA N-terminal domain-containing protein [Sphingomonas sp. H160509]MDD1450636.1 SurA N-terminal domain-containing protein [Sphingomonas sp. H160509]